MSPDRSTSSRPGAYVHVPFCSAICPYCDFAVTRGDRPERARFVARLAREIDLLDVESFGRLSSLGPCDTVYFGGGTPSLLSSEELRRLLDRLVASGWVGSDAIIHLEVNPEDVNETSVRAFREIGASFVSLGVQSFSDEALRFLGRRHRAKDAVDAVTTALDANFPIVSLDLMYGLPEQSLDDWRLVLDRAAELGPDHISCYQLTVHAGTPFGRRRERGTLKEAGDEMQASLFRMTHERLAEHGYEGYEVSNFARSAEHRSPHNQKYWEHVPYLGIGPSAHSFDGRARWWNERSLSAWSESVDAGRPPISTREELEDSDLALEAVMLGLRTQRGVDLHALETRARVRFLEWNHELLERLVGDGLVELAESDSRLRPTLAGMAVADGLASAFALTAEEARA